MGREGGGRGGEGRGGEGKKEEGSGREEQALTGYVLTNGPDSLKSIKVNFFSIGICYL